MQTNIEEMKELVRLLNEAGKAYYQEDREIMSNFEYDRLYDRLKQLEQETHTILADSPTVQVGYEVLSELPKERHAYPMLSLDKTKDREALGGWLKSNQGLLSWKLDGLTIVLTYREGILFKAVTRGNGAIGEIITNNARVFKNLPHQIPYEGELVLRGEAVIKYSDFERINATIDDVDAKYKNPRNLCSGSVRQLNNEVTAKRNVHFFSFALVQADGIDFSNSRTAQLEWLKQMGFEAVEYCLVDADNIVDAVNRFEQCITGNDFPSDGLVLTLDDIAYSRSLGATAKFPRDSIAFKWSDEIKETQLLEIEWSASRTGLINPVAIFEPVELEGTTVSRASVHNLSIMENLQLGIGDIVEVYKANMIIPQIAGNLTRSGEIHIPGQCPVCQQQTQIRQVNDVKVLYCPNPTCEAKQIKSYAHFVSRDAFNIEGLSEATLEKLVQRRYLMSYADLFHLDQYQEEIVEMEGFGAKSYANLIAAIDKARQIHLPNFIYSLGIAGVGLSNARLICAAMDNSLDSIRSAETETFVEIAGIGPVIAESMTAYFKNEENVRNVDTLLAEVIIEQEQVNDSLQSLSGKVFVITGSVEQFANRNKIKQLIEQRGGKVTGSVTSKTDYLINNDVTSKSTKNKKAKELDIPIITELDFLTMLG